MARRRTTRAFAAGAALLCAIALLFATGVLRPVTGAAQALLFKAAAPVYAAGAAISRAAFAAGARCGDGQALESLRVENANLRTLVAENDALKEALGFKERAGDDAVPARVVSRTDDDVFRGLIIDRGTEDGIAAGQPVVFGLFPEASANGGGGVIIGKIMTVKARSAAVLLLTDSRSKLAVSIENAVDTVGVLEGDRGLSMAISLIPQAEPIAPGDMVITSGIEPGVRRGLVVGMIDKIERANQDPFQSATIAPLRMAAVPTFVLVLRGPAG